MAQLPLTTLDRFASISAHQAQTHAPPPGHPPAPLIIFVGLNRFCRSCCACVPLLLFLLFFFFFL